MPNATKRHNKPDRGEASHKRQHAFTARRIAPTRSEPFKHRHALIRQHSYTSLNRTIHHVLVGALHQRKKKKQKRNMQYQNLGAISPNHTALSKAVNWFDLRTCRRGNHNGGGGTSASRYDVRVVVTSSGRAPARARTVRLHGLSSLVVPARAPSVFQHRETHHADLCGAAGTM